jgi:hypothetical protein
MSSVSIAGDTSGAIVLAAPAVAGANTLTLPATTGTLLVPGNASSISLGTPQTTTSGTSFTFTGIPSWAKRIKVFFSGTQLSGGANYLIQIGSGSVTTSGYLSATGYTGTSTGATSPATATTGFVCQSGNSNNLAYGCMTIELASTSFLYIANHVHGMTQSGNPYATIGGGNVTLGGAADRVKITTTNGTDTFVAGSLNISYE